MRRPVRRSQAGQLSFPAPVAGLVENTPMAAPNPLGAEVLENFIPTQRGIAVRGGATQYAYINASVAAMFGYAAGGNSKLFAASASAIFDVTDSISSASSPNSGALIWGSGVWGTSTWGKSETPLAGGFTSGDWSAQQIGTSGGDFLIAVNGSDPAQIYDGTDMNPLTGSAVNEIDFDGMTAAFSVGETLTGGSSGATAEILSIIQLTGSTGTLKLGAITGGPFTDDEEITSAGGAAFANGASASASALTITGVTTSDLSHVWLYQNRMFFVQKNSLKAWYLPSGSVGGAAQDVSLAGVFRRGGKLLFGGTWSLDSGDGMDDKCLFVSDLGEVAVYSGVDPSSASTWAFEGRYDIGKPLGKNATAQIGGDFLVATDDGIVPISAAIQRDPSALSLSAVTGPIETTWSDEARRASDDVQLIKWTAGDLMLAVFPQADRMLTANLQTTAWATQTGWHGTCGATYSSGVFVGRDDGFVMKLDSGGTDDGAPFTARVCFSFNDMGDPMAYKVPQLMRGAYFADDSFDAKFSVSAEYDVKFPAAPSAVASTSGALVWGSGAWGVGTWAGDVESPRMGVLGNWEAVSGGGHTLAPMVQITSGGAQKLPVELVRVDFIAESGGRVA
ncbi:hypothetical protein [Phaeobacter gallaeciensis]|uniref:hypothetical protein n=1 Tax=Phaeobacter gallaeciensis TaxID=60890 RepID=UPI0023A9AD8C|nr:hypothetical protein [Phaeobacter gallaeciensis]MDE4274761.1 hypothetical protein [Phaeobacter gallaeciensis]MDE5184830.1 hypothetical protein [Phaeobacter gallaeciensis]